MAPRRRKEDDLDRYYALNLLGSLQSITDNANDTTATNATTAGSNIDNINTIPKNVTNDVKKKDVPLITRVGRLIKGIIFTIVLVCLIRKNQNLNLFLLCGRIVHLFVYPIISLRDMDAPTSLPVPIEYDVQTHAIVGLFAYTIALLLLYMNASNPILVWLNSFNVSQIYIALCIAAGFENGDIKFTSYYCTSFDYSDSKTVIDHVFEQLTMPLCLLCLVGLQNINQLEEYNTYIKISITVFFAYRMVLLRSDYNKALSTQTADSAERDSDSGLVNPPGHEHVWRIYGNEYDVTDFVKSHPGGVESIMLGANREDCTAMFQSYHAFSIHKAKSVLAKYRISSSATTSTSTLEDDKKLQGSNPIGHHNDLFYEELVKRVSKTLLDNGIDPIKDRYASWGRYFVYAILITSTIVSGYYHLTGSLVGTFLFAVAGTYMSGNVGHDGGHFAISKFPLVNNVCLWGMFFGCNPIVWQHQHTYAHHSYTNHDTHDPDVHHFDMVMRYNPLTTWRPLNKLQIHKIYILLAFCFTDYGTCYFNAWRFIFERSLHGVVEWTDRKRRVRTAALIFHLVAYAAICYIVPFWFHKNSWTAVLAGAMHILTSGFIFGIFSQIGHISELALTSVRDPIKARESRHFIAKDSWAAAQVEATNDFCPQSYVWFITSLLLNVQIEHHLFPCLNHRHLPLIQPTVEECCLEYNVHYKKYNSFNDLLSDTFTYIHSLANDATTSSVIGNKKHE